MPDNPTAEAPAATQDAPAIPEMPLPPPSSPTADSPDAAFDEVFKDEVAPATKAAKAPKEPEPKADAEPESEADDATKAPAGPDREALTKALGVLRRDNVPQKIIDQLLDDPAELLAWAEKAGKRQGDIDKRLGGSKPEQEAKETPAEPQAEPTGSPATDKALADLVRPFADEMGSEHAEEALTKLAKHVRDSTLAEVAPVLENFERSFAAMSGMLERMVLKEARANLQERFPQVSEDASWDKVLERARTLSTTGGYDDIESMVADAARLELSDMTVRDRQRDMARKHSARSNGTPTPPTRARKHTPATPDELREAVLDEIFPN